MLMTSAFWIAILAALITLTSLYVTIVRGQTKVMHGDDGNERLARARRAHLTAMEFSVPFIGLVIVYEKMAGADSWILWTGALFLAGRLLHVIYMYGFSGLHPLRGIGAVASHAGSIILLVLILARLF